MFERTDIEQVLKHTDQKGAETIYGLSDGQIYLNGNAEDILELAELGNLEIYTFKGEELVKPQSNHTENVI
jgi:hypothetical protein